MEFSLFLAKVFGLYFVAVITAIFLRRKELPEIAEAFVNDKLHMLTSGSFIMLLGLAVVISHNVWELSFRGAITLIGWLTLLKGGMRLFAPHVAEAAVKKINMPLYWALLAFFFVFGLWLAYIGFTY